MSTIDWNKAPVDATHAGHAGNNICWYRHSNGIWSYLYDDDYNSSCGWEAVIDEPGHHPIIKRISTWSGEGLPPVGTVCELSSQGADWGIGTIQYTAENVIVWRWENQAVGQACACYKHEIKIRSIRTSEQIAAEERKAAIEEMTAGYDGKYGLLADWATYVYDTLGYRKQGEQP